MLSFVKRLLGSSRPSPGRKARFQPSIETLEDRLVPSVSWNSATATLVIRGDEFGTPHNDKYVLSTRVGSIDQIVHYTDGRQDVAFDIPSEARGLDIDGGLYTDTIVVGTLSHSYKLKATNPEYFTVNNSRIDYDITITTTSNGPSTALKLDCSSESNGRWFVLNSNSLHTLEPRNDPRIPSVFSDVGIQLGSAHISSLVINTGSGNDSVRVNATPAATTINTGGGSDNVYVGNTLVGQTMSSYFNGDLSGLTGALTVNGGSAGQDQLFVSDGANTSTNLLQIITAGTFTNDHGMSIYYSGFEQTAFNTGGASGLVYVSSTAAGVPTQVVTSSAMPVEVGGHSSGGAVIDDLGGIRGSLSLNAINTSGTAIPGGALTLDDNSHTAGHSYTITRDPKVTVTREDGVSIVSSAMSTVTLRAGNGNDTFTTVDTNSQSIPTPVTVNGWNGGDKLIQQLTWNVNFVINGLNAGTAFGVTFYNVENLVGGSADDAFILQTGGRLPSGTVDGGGGINTLDYSALTTGVTVDLSARVATGVFGGAANGIANIRNVVGSKGDDLLRGDINDNDLRGVDGNDILIGLDGMDNLKARGVDNVGAATTRRCILIGGNGADTLEGSEGEDIVLGGSFENNVDNNDNVLRAFMGVWKDSTRDYASRTRTLNRDGVSVNGTTYKIDDNSTKIHDDAIDAVFAKGGLDWFWTEDQDTTDRISGEELRDV